ncbi:alcohol dehydrogenase [Phycicoccus sp. Root563]|uniref:NADPH:quinone oxidoreductase family protein n=1 Tax=unclassified Phycicoccus TaxID=2637926 RepID=UPI0007030A38|nr:MULTISPECIES: NADPH:quinone oxidoreductase family protein [unclassified Phycicoccus]KQU66507.1 alcohol dehydrogenase [Phycicoccus sp. Root101]KQZ87658.1 alcohol dehydrogenase [Phycicoccus sp. Root563]
MHAWQVTALGEPADVLALAEVPSPQVPAGHVRVRVLATALNFPDVLMARGHYQVRPELPFVPGVEVCGEVLEVGPGDGGVTTDPHVSVGDRVVGTTAMPHGGLAQEALLPLGGTFAAPSSLDDAAASCLTIGYQTAYVGLVRRAGLRRGETLLVHAAAGGVGSAAVQVGKALGARVVAVVGGEAKAAVAREAGADVVVDRTAGDLVAGLKDALGRSGADVVFDPVGGASYDASTKVVAFEGRIVVVGFTSGTIPAPALGHALVKNYSILGLHWGLYLQRDPAVAREAHAALTAMADAGQIRPVVSERVAFGDAPTALTSLGAGRTTGRLVVMAR